MIGPISLFIGSVPNGQIYIVLNLPNVCMFYLKRVKRNDRANLVAYWLVAQ